MVSAKSCIITSLLLLASSLANAGEVKTFGDLDQLQGERVWYEQLAAANKAKREASEQNGAAFGVVNQANGVNTQPLKQDFEMPQLTKIFGSVNSMKAKLSYPNGNETVNKAGDVIPGGFKIISITINGVTAVQIDTGKKITIN